MAQRPRPLADERQPESKPLVPAGPTPQTVPSRPPPSPIEAQIAKRLESVQLRMVRAGERVIQIETEQRNRPRKFDVRAFAKSLPRSFLLPGSANIEFPTVRFTPDPEAEAVGRELEELKQEAVSLFEENIQLGNQLLLAQGVPGLVASENVNTIDDVVSKLGNMVADPADLAVAQKALDRAIQVRESQRRSLDTNVSDVIKAVGSKRNITLYGLTALASSADPVALINSLRAPQFAPGATPADTRQVLADEGLPAAELRTLIQEAEDFSIVMKRSFDTMQTRSLVWKGDMLNAIDNGTFAQEMKNFRKGISFFDNPGLYIGLPIDWLQKNYWRPLAGSALKNFQYVRGSTIPIPSLRLLPQDPIFGSITVDAVDSFLGVSAEQSAQFDLEYRKAVQSGENFWRAYGVAFDNTDVNAVTKIAIEIVADPTSYMGFGVVTKLAKPFPVINTAVRGFEYGWMRTVDVPFIGLQKVISWATPKLPFQIAARDAAKHLQVVIDYLNEAFPKGVPAIQMGMVRVKENLEIALDVLWKNPQHSGLSTDAVRGLLERPMITLDDASAFGRRLGSDVPSQGPAQLDAFASDLDELLSQTRALPGGAAHVPEETVTLILGRAGVTRTDETVRIVSELIRRERQAALSKFSAIIGVETYPEFLKGVLAHRRFVLGANQKNPLSAYRSRTAMLMTSMRNGRTGSVLSHLASFVSMANWLSVGISRMYLMSTAYQPFNTVELSGKLAALGITPWYRGGRMAELQANMMGFETLAPEMFLGTTDIFVPQLQDIGTAGATAIAKHTGTRNAFRRIWGTKRNALSKLYDSSSELFTKSLGRLNLEGSAHMLNSLFKRHLIENSQTGPVVKEIYDLTLARTSGLRSHMAEDLVEVHQTEMARRAIIAPESLNDMAAEFVSGYSHAIKVQEIASKYQNLSPEIHAHLTDLSISGDIWRLMREGDLDTRVTEALWNEILTEPTVILARTRELVRGIIDTPPRNLEELQVQITMLQDLSSATGHVVSGQMSATQAYTRDILSIEKKDLVWKTQWTDVIEPIIQSSEDAARQIVESLKQSLRSGGYDVPQHTITQYDELINDQLIHIQILNKARISINDVTRTMLDERAEILRSLGGRGTVDSPEIIDWWARFNSGRDMVWKNAQEELAESSGDIAMLAGSLDAMPVPQPRDVSAQPLVMNDVAQLFGVSPDSVTQGMYLSELKMMRPKAEWVNVVYRQARRVSRQIGSDPDTLGYTKARLGVVYDDHLKSVRLRPEVQLLAEPRLAEWKSLLSELNVYALGKDIVLKPSAAKALDDAAKGLLADIKASPVAREVIAPEPRPIGVEGLPDMPHMPGTPAPTTLKERLVSMQENLVLLDNRGQLDPARVALMRDIVSRLGPEEALPTLKGMEMELLTDLKSEISRATDAGISGIGGEDIIDFIKLEEIERTVSAIMRDDIAATQVTLQAVRSEIARVSNLPKPAGVRPVTRAMEVEDLTTRINAFVSARAGQDLWFHGGVALEEGEGLVSGFITKDLDTAIGYATDASRGRPDTGFVHVVDIADTGLSPGSLVDDLGQPTDVRVMSDDIDEVVPLGSFDVLAEDLGVLPPSVPGLGVEVESVWAGKRRSAFKDAVDEYNINQPVYDRPNAVNAALKFIMPFWTYEAHRITYLPRIAMKNPGLTHAWGLYGDNTDRGYIPLPRVPLQANFLRSNITMGGMQRWVNRDFPEFYDRYPGFANYLDIANRSGFYVNIYGSAFMASKWANKAGTWQTGEIVPPVVGSALEAIIALDPDNGFADALAEIILPNRFRDYRISTRMAMILPEGQEARGSEILDKRNRGEDLTSEEKQIWDSAEWWVSLYTIFDYQLSITRLRPEEKVAAQKLTKDIILRYVPITSEQYDESRKMGMRIEDYYPFPVELNEELRSIEELSRWRGHSSNLGESARGNMLLMQRNYWQQVEDRRTTITTQEEDLDRRFRTLGSDHINRKDWESEKRKLTREMNRFIEDLKASDDFKDVPIDYQDRVEYAVKHDIPAPIQEPLEEMITYYFSKNPEDFQFYDPEVGARVTDWDGFYMWKRTLERSLSGENQTRFLTRTRRFDTELDAFRRADYETFIRPYKNLFGITLAEFSPDEQSVIRQFYAADNINVRETLRGIESGGGKLVSGFQSILSERKKRFRLLDPEIDARLAFWDGATTVASETARSIYNALYPRYGIQSPEEVLIESISLVPSAGIQ